MGDYLNQLFEVLWGVLRFQEVYFSRVQTRDNLIAVSLGITFLGGISLLTGQAVILIFNRISIRRMLASLLLNGVVYTASLVIWAIIAWAIGQFVFNLNLEFRDTIRILLLTAAPMVFAFLALIPYLGGPIVYVLQVWSLLLTFQIIDFQYGTPPIQTITIVGLGWFIVTAASYLIGGPLSIFRDLIRGNVIVVESNETIMNQILDRGRAEMNGLVERIRGYSD